MPRPSLPPRAARALFLRRQHLRHPRAAPLSAARLVRFVEDAGGLQLDSINVLERAHYLTVWSRFGPYDRARLDRLAYERRLLFEYWAHAACLVSTRTLPWWRRAMLDYRIRHTGWSDWLQRNGRVLARVKAAVAANGPMGNADFARPRGAGKASGWWDWKPAQHALHYLWMTGVLTVHSRRHFHKRFDLLDRALPAAAGVVPATRDAFARWHVERSLHAMGVATEADVRGYLTFPRFAPGARRDALRALVGARARGARGGAVTRHDAARAVRLAPLVSRARRAAVRLRLPDRGLHAGRQARARLLHAADPARRPPDRPRPPTRSRHWGRSSAHARRASRA
jgi:uncharacterized protein YcaQ